MHYSLSILVCSYNRHFLLRKCISNLIKIRENIIPIEIVVIDDGSEKKIDENFKVENCRDDNIDNILKELYKTNAFTSKPSLTNLSTIWDPINPSEPVTNIFFIINKFI